MSNDKCPSCGYPLMQVDRVNTRYESRVVEVVNACINCSYEDVLSSTSYGRSGHRDYTGSNLSDDLQDPFDTLRQHKQRDE